MNGESEKRERREQKNVNSSEKVKDKEELIQFFFRFFSPLVPPVEDEKSRCSQKLSAIAYV